MVSPSRCAGTAFAFVHLLDAFAERGARIPCRPLRA